MRVFFVGDVFGKPGRAVLRKLLPDIKSQESPDFIVANVENAAGGRGLTPALSEEFFQMGIHVLTLGNHTWDQKEVDKVLPDPRILRPANYPKILPGHGWGIFSTILPRPSPPCLPHVHWSPPVVQTSKKTASAVVGR